MRSYKTIINEAELQASSPERVYQWLEMRSQRGVEPYLNEIDADEELELALLSRNQPLINLGLAKFGVYPKVANKLFAFACAERDALRLCILSNGALAKESIWGLLPELFDQKEDTNAWLGAATAHEISALFENPQLGDSFLTDFLEGKEVWEAMDDDRRLTAIHALVRNLRMKKPYDGIMDGWAEYSHGAVFNAAWELAETAPTAIAWANALGWLYDVMRRDAFSIDDPISVAKRWHPAPTDEAALKREDETLERGFLSPYQRVRKGLGMLALAKKPALLLELLDSADLAFRTAAYARGNLSPEQITAAYERDKELAVNEAIDNENLWRESETRQALHDISWQAVKDNERSDLMAANIFNGVKDRMAKQHPDWFAESDWQSEPSDGPATKVDLHQVAARHSAEIEAVVAATQQAQKTLETLSKHVGWVWWFSIIALGILVRWRFF